MLVKSPFALSLFLLCLTAGVTTADSFADGSVKPVLQPSVEQGREAVWTVSSPLTSTFGAWRSLWKKWGLAEEPEDFLDQTRERYGLHESTRDGHTLPMGLKRMSTPFGPTLGHNCLLCHAGRIAGQTIIGLGNASLDLQSLIEELSSREPISIHMPFRIANGRGIIEASAGTIYLMQYRDSELNMRAPRKLTIDDELCHDLPAWWNVRTKKTMFHTGATDVRSTRSNVSFFLAPLNSGEFVRAQEPVIADIFAFIRTLEPPKYPFPIDRTLAGKGEAVFVETCSECHGTYGKNRHYPNVIIPVKDVGTDPTLATFDGSGDLPYYLASWIYREKGPDGEPLHLLNYGGYQAPPLDGVWATAPYFHNGSVPTIAGVLDSRSRPAIYTRSFSCEKDAYDSARVGWKTTPVTPEAVSKLSGHELRRVTDTRRRGRGNQGHTFGDALTLAQRTAVLEFLKTL